MIPISGRRNGQGKKLAHGPRGDLHQNMVPTKSLPRGSSSTKEQIYRPNIYKLGHNFHGQSAVGRISFHDALSCIASALDRKSQKTIHRGHNASLKKATKLMTCLRGWGGRGPLDPSGVGGMPLPCPPSLRSGGQELKPLSRALEKPAVFASNDFSSFSSNRN